MLYWIVRPVARYVLSYYFRTIDVSGLENIPESGAVILAANHPTAFLEPCMLACYQRRSLHFLARGDLYKNFIASALLRALHILPVFRLRDGGFGKLRNNFDTFEACFRVLNRQGAVMILAEGRCIHGKNLLPLQKGTARLALGALEASPTLSEVYVVPVGVNFTHADRARSQVMIRCGKPIRASAFRTAYRSSPATGLQEFTEHLRGQLAPLVVHFPDPAETAWREVLLEASRPAEAPDRRDEFRDKGQQVRTETLLARTQDPARDPATQLGLHLRRLNVTMGAVAGATNGLKSKEMKGNVGLGSLAVVLLLPWIYLWLLAQWIADTFVGTVEFHSPVRFAVIAVGTLLYVPLTLLVFPYEFAAWVWLSLPLIPTGIRLWERIERRNEQRAFERATPADQDLLKQCYRQVREQIRQVLKSTPPGNGG